LLYPGEEIFRISKGDERKESILREAQFPIGIFAQNDVIALETIEKIEKWGYHVPEDIAIIGFSNLDEGRDFRIPLSSVDYDIESMAKLATERLIDSLGGNPPSYPAPIFPCNLVIRESTSKKKSQLCEGKLHAQFGQ
jgi:DNA-binding LacI/PurR family transcriptional regulator